MPYVTTSALKTTTFHTSSDPFKARFVTPDATQVVNPLDPTKNKLANHLNLMIHDHSFKKEITNEGEQHDFFSKARDEIKTQISKYD